MTLRAETCGGLILAMKIFRAFLLLYQLTVSKLRIYCSSWRDTLYRTNKFAANSNKPTFTVLSYLHVALVIKHTFTSPWKSYQCV